MPPARVLPAAVGRELPTRPLRRSAAASRPVPPGASARPRAALRHGGAGTGGAAAQAPPGGGSSGGGSGGAGRCLAPSRPFPLPPPPSAQRCGEAALFVPRGEGSCRARGAERRARSRTATCAAPHECAVPGGGSSPVPSAGYPPPRAARPLQRPLARPRTPDAGAGGSSAGGTAAIRPAAASGAEAEREVCQPRSAAPTT